MQLFWGLIRPEHTDLIIHKESFYATIKKKRLEFDPFNSSLFVALDVSIPKLRAQPCC